MKILLILLLTSLAQSQTRTKSTSLSSISTKTLTQNHPNGKPSIDPYAEVESKLQPKKPPVRGSKTQEQKDRYYVKAKQRLADPEKRARRNERARERYAEKRREQGYSPKAKSEKPVRIAPVEGARCIGSHQDPSKADHLWPKSPE